MNRMATTTKSPADELSDRQLRELYRAATPTRKLAVVARLNATLISLKEADLQARFPKASAEEQRAMLRRWWLTASD